MFAQVVFPLPFRNSFTYSIHVEHLELVKIGVRVVVPFGKRTLTGFVVDVSETTDVEGKIKPIRDVLDNAPIFDESSLKFYEWLSSYYISSLGEALRNSVPYGLEVESKRKIVSDMDHCFELYKKEKNKKSTRAKVLDILSQKEVIKISQLQKLVKKKSIHSILKTLEKNGAITLLTEIEDAKVHIKKVKYVKLSKNIDEIYEYLPEIEARSPKQVVLLLELLAAKGEPIQMSQLLKKTNTNPSSIKSLFKKDLIDIFEKEVERRYIETYEEIKEELTLTGYQKEIVDNISEKIGNEKFATYLLHGITGSGKTQVYIELVNKAISMGKSAIVLVPEISLTPQITSRFYNELGDHVTVMHSRMSLGERYDAWRGVIKGKYKVVIGPRSALFAPLKDIGLIVVDEEHDSSYKQYEIIPKYNARDAAVVKAQMSNCPVVLGSATPSIESMYNALSGKYELCELKERIDDAKLPQVHLVDVTIEQKKKKMDGAFSKILLEKISDRIHKEESVIILQNRRGFATQIYCEDCGEIEMCDDCSVSMVHHINRNILQCHYCGSMKPVPKACRHCGSLSLKFFGTGTQRVEDELQYYFPDVKIERVDSDSINKKGMLGEILNRFRRGETNILVGTQIVAKGLDFANVTLVGVISAETTLWLPDFRADERTFQLLTQVSGRAGRSRIEGEVIIQTHNKNHFVLQKVLLNDYEGFYSNEIALRQKNNYPPFTRLCLIESKNENEKNARGAITDFFNILIKKKAGLIINAPTPALIARIKGQYRFHLLVKSPKKTDPGGKLLREAITESWIEYNQRSKFSDIRLTIDMDPQGIM
ncbi:Helicase PriA essential for oriC/DnaA-independent DNA replication [hydrothermal vent metagenome]|uniref:DNA 3'-5' helicase n=1 Tax=hydrothermal vent metagenome TaxID=652676 RepID=A0A3B1D1I7_9ZZZZ